MAFEYQYSTYNPGQYPADVQAQWDAMVSAGWQAHTVSPHYSEISIFWQREIPEEKPASRRRKDGPASPGDA